MLYVYIYIYIYISVCVYVYVYVSINGLFASRHRRVISHRDTNVMVRDLCHGDLMAKHCHVKIIIVIQTHQPRRGVFPQTNSSISIPEPMLTKFSVTIWPLGVWRICFELLNNQKGLLNNHKTAIFLATTSKSYMYFFFKRHRWWIRCNDMFMLIC